MNALRSAFAELAGLFVEDRWFALAIAFWLVVCAIAAHTNALSPALRGDALFAGLAAVLITSVLKGAAT